MSKSMTILIALFACCFGVVLCLLIISSDITEQKGQIAALRAENSNLDKRIVALHSQIKDRDEEILKLKKDIKFLEETLK